MIDGTLNTGPAPVPGKRLNTDRDTVAVTSGQRTTGTKAVRRHFDSVTAMVDYIEGTEPLASQPTSSVYDHGRDWTLGLNYRESLKLARDGWRDASMINEVARIVESVETSIGDAMVKRVSRRRDMVGPRLDVGRLIGGDPKCAIRTVVTKRPGAGPVVRIVFNVCTSAGVSGMAMAKRGAVVCAVAELLKGAGWSTEIVMLSHNEIWCRGGGSTEHTTSVQIKHSDQDMDIGDLLFSLAHPAMFRRLGFATLERETKTIPGGYGQVPGDIPADLYGDVTLAKGYHLREIDRDPIKWAIDQLKGIGLINSDQGE